MKIKDAANYLNVHYDSLLRWEREGKIKPIRTPGGHRRYTEEMLDKFIGRINKPINDELKITVGYARVSTKSDYNNLIRQKEVLELYCAKNGWNHMIIDDIGSGLNYNKGGLIKLIKMILTNKCNRLVVNYKDRLLRFGNELLFELCKFHNVDIVIINESENKTYEQELVDDVLSIITVFSAKLYGSRSHKSKRVIEENSKLFNSCIECEGECDGIM